MKAFKTAILALLATGIESFSIGSNNRIATLTRLQSSQQQQQQPIKEKDVSKLKSFGRVLLDRSDTLKSAGFYDANEHKHPPLHAGAKTNITLFLVALGYKWYRSIFINKVSKSNDFGKGSFQKTITFFLTISPQSCDKCNV